METIYLLGSAMGIGFVCGLNLYATILAVGLGIRLGVITLSPEFAQLEVLASPSVLVTAGAIYLIEFVADKIPWVDSLWDVLHTLIRPLGAAVLGAAAVGAVSAEAALVAALCAGVAFCGHAAKAGIRVAINHSPEPFSNTGVSLAEDAVVVAGTWLALTHPLIMLAAVALFLVAFAWLAPKALRLTRVELMAALLVLKRSLTRLLQPAPVMMVQRVMAGASATSPPAAGQAPVAAAFDSPATRLPPRYMEFLDEQALLARDGLSLRCVAGRGVQSLRHSVGYLHVTRGGLVFVTRRNFRFRVHQIDRSDLQDVNFRLGLLLHRLGLKVAGTRRQFLLFRDSDDAAQHLVRALTERRGL